MSRAFFTAVGGLFVFVVFQPAYGQARLGGAVNIRELALVDISAPLWRMGQSPEKLQIFLCYSPIAFCLVWGGDSFSPESPSPISPRGESPFLLSLRLLGSALSPWEGHDGVFLGFCRANKG